MQLLAKSGPGPFWPIFVLCTSLIKNAMKTDVFLTIIWIYIQNPMEFQQFDAQVMLSRPIEKWLFDKILKAFLSDFKVFFSNIKLQLFLGNSETNLDGIDLYKL